MNKLVSVIMSTYNEKELQLRLAIESILNQTYENLEFIIVLDNPENKEIQNILEEYSKKESKVKLIYNVYNIGLANSLNKAVEISKGKYIARMDADDISLRNRIEKQIRYLEENNLDVVATNRIDINENGDQLPLKSSLPKTQRVNKLLPIGNFITHPTVLIRVEAFKAVNGYREFFCSQDYDLWLRFLSSGYKIGILDEALLYYRNRENSISNSDKLKQYLHSNYQKKLYKKQIKYGKDDFSKEDLNYYLTKNNYYNEQYKNTFNLAYSKFEEGIMYLKNKKHKDGFLALLSSIRINYGVSKIIIENIKYQLTKRIYQ